MSISEALAPPAFVQDAVCSQTDPELFFPEKGGSTKDAKSVCLACPVRVRCLTWAMQTDQRFGVWGGLSEKERTRLRRQAAAAAVAPQPKAPREPASCGTYAAWSRHKRRNEPIDDACHAAFLAKRTEDRRRAGAQPRQPAECGTRAGYQRHLRLGEKACDPCRQANTDADNRLRRTGTTKAA